MQKLLHIVLVQPRIGNNAGAVGRTCLAFNAALHLVGPLGFSTSDAAVRRAGLDYWQHVDVNEYKDWSTFYQRLPAIAKRHYFLSRFAERSIMSCQFFGEQENDKNDDDNTTDQDSPHRHSIALICGSEVAGLHRLLPGDVLNEDPDRLLRLPMEPGSVRSLNLATSAAIALYDVYREMLEKGIISRR